MKRNIFAACGALAVAGLTLFASQTPSPTPPAQPAPAAGTVTVTGCLKPWTGAASGSTASTGAAGSMAQYVLTDVEHKGGGMSSGSPAPGATGTAAATGTTGAMTRHGEGGTDHEYVVRADSTAVNLSPHVNHKVELTGRVTAADASRGTSMSTPSTPSAPGTPTTPGTSGTPGTTPSATGTTGRPQDMPKTAKPTLTVSALKMVSATCP